MERRPPLTLDEVGEAILELRARGEKVTARNIYSILKRGSMSTIHKLKDEYLDLEEREAALPEISEEFLKALKTGVGKAIKAATEKLTQALASVRSQRNEANETIKTIEGEKFALEELASEYQKIAQDAQQTAGSLNDQLSEAVTTAEKLAGENDRLTQEKRRLSDDLTAALARETVLQQTIEKLLNTMKRNETVPKRKKP